MGEMWGAKVPNLKNYVCLVTGASRGIGKGIAIALGECGATVYITGRTCKPAASNPANGDCSAFPVGCLEVTAAEINARGGVGIPVAVDHSDDSQVNNLFARIRREHCGRLDLLVNNAFSAVNYITSHKNKSFWELDAVETPAFAWDAVNKVGLRNHYICATLGTRIMLECRGELEDAADKQTANEASTDLPVGLIVNISSIGGLRYLFNVPYGIGKCAMDRMAADMGHELRARDKSVSIISLWPGLVKTENMLDYAGSNPDANFDFDGHGESCELTGRVIAALAALPSKEAFAMCGHTLLVADTALQFGIRDVDGKWPRSMRSVKYLLEAAGWNRLSYLFPNFFCLPYSIFSLAGSRF